jgi:hypothetical protein
MDVYSVKYYLASLLKSKRLLVNYVMQIKEVGGIPWGMLGHIR